MKLQPTAFALLLLCCALSARAQGPAMAVTPGSQTIIATAQQATYTVETSGRWAASSDQTWASVSRVEQEGNGFINVTCAVNLGAGPRTATVTVTGIGTTPGSVAVTLTQAPPAALAVTPDPLDVSDEAQTAVFDVDTTVRWRATSAEPWASISPEIRNGAGPLSVFVSPNFGPPRTTVITIRGVDPTDPRALEVTLNQAERPPALTATPSQQNIASPTQSVSFFVTTTANWTAESDQPWATVSAGPATGPGALAVAVAANDSGADRTATITITGANSRPATVTVQVVQSTVPGLSASPLFTPIDEVAQEVDIEVVTTSNWSASSNAPWATVDEADQTGEGTLTVSVAENDTFTARTALITLTGEGTEPATVFVTIFQDPTLAPGCESIDECRATLLSNFDRGDENNDRALSLEEAQGILAGLTPAQFDEIDRNSDGRLRMPELRPVQSILLILLGLIFLFWQRMSNLFPTVG